MSEMRVPVSRIPANTKYLYDICTMSAQRRRRWADVVQMLYKYFVSGGCAWDHYIYFPPALQAWIYGRRRFVCGISLRPGRSTEVINKHCVMSCLDWLF